MRVLWNGLAVGQKPDTARVYEWSRGPEETAAEGETLTGWTEISLAERRRKTRGETIVKGS